MATTSPPSRLPYGARTCQTQPQPSISKTCVSSLLSCFKHQLTHTVRLLHSHPRATHPLADASALWSKTAYCESRYSNLLPTVPHNPHDEATALATEQGFKRVHGLLTEGRYLTFEHDGFVLTNPGSTSFKIGARSVTAGHESKSQRWVLEQLAPGGKMFHAYSALDGRYWGRGWGWLGRVRRGMLRLVIRGRVVGRWCWVGSISL